MTKKILVIIILIGLVFSVMAINRRVQVEDDIRELELILDYPGLQQLALNAGRPEEDILKALSEAGLTSLAVYPLTMEELIDGDLINVLQGQEIIEAYSVSGRVNPPYDRWVGLGLDNGDYVFFSSRRGLIDWLAGTFQSRGFGIQRRIEDGNYYLWLPDGHFSLTYPLGFSPEQIELALEANLKLVPRFTDYPGFSPEVLESWIAELPDGSWDLVVFAGNNIPGYPSEHPAQLVERLEGKVIGYIEPFIGYQEGSKELVAAADFAAVRVHSIQQEEMDKYALEKVVDRYVRAVQERNVTALYLKPFLSLEGKPYNDLLKLNQQFISELAGRFSRMGYEIGQVRPFPAAGSSLWEVAVFMFAVVAAGLLLIKQFFCLRPLLNVLLGGIIAAGFIFLLLKGYVLLSREVIALGAAVIFPSLAGISIVDRLSLGIGSRSGNARHYGVAIWFQPVILVVASLISLLGGLFVGTLLFQTRYLLKVSQFRGVKLSFLLPLLIVSAYLVVSWYREKEFDNWGDLLQGLWSEPICWKHLIIMGLLGLLGLAYIGRTGNFPLLPVPPWELWVRRILEDLFIVRPRFKEFLVGYPAFFLLLLFYRYRYKTWNWLLLLLVMVGQINIVNTFSHLHTPVLISFWRTILGLGLGLILGYLLFSFYSILAWLYRRLTTNWQGSS
ncbi:MAG: DUF5693 family protein [Halanaerobium sp.]|nr:DUF5693 family protein [Halanaerobium sp.]